MKIVINRARGFSSAMSHRRRFAALWLTVNEVDEPEKDHVSPPTRLNRFALIAGCPPGGAGKNDR